MLCTKLRSFRILINQFDIDGLQEGQTVHCGPPKATIGIPEDAGRPEAHARGHSHIVSVAPREVRLDAEAMAMGLHDDASEARVDLRLLRHSVSLDRKSVV